MVTNLSIEEFNLRDYDRAKRNLIDQQTSEWVIFIPLQGLNSEARRKSGMHDTDSKLLSQDAARIFFSYAREDAAFVNVIATFLAPLPIPLFVDTKSILPGQKWEDHIVDELDKATHVYVFWSKAAAESKWVAVESELAAASGKIVIPVRMDNTKMPPYLSRYSGIDVRSVESRDRTGEIVPGDKSKWYVSVGYEQLSKRLGDSSIFRVLPKPQRVKLRPDGWEEVDPRRVGLAMYGALAEMIRTT